MLEGDGQGTYQDKRRVIDMKMQITVTITNEDESALTEPTTVVVSIPEVEDYSSPEVFDQVFERYEQDALEARNGVMEEATGKYLSAVAKKKRKKSQPCEEEHWLKGQRSI